jgi:hypothetical protein
MHRLIATLSRWWAGLKKRGGDFVDLFKPRGHVELWLIHAEGPQKGDVAQIIKGRNVVTGWLSSGGVAPTSGRDMMRRILVPSGFSGELSTDADATISEVRLGSGTTAEASSDTSLDTEIAGSDEALVSVEFDLINPYVTFIFEYDESEVNVTISEAGLFSGRGDFIARKTFGAFTKTTQFTLQVRWQIRF